MAAPKLEPIMPMRSPSTFGFLARKVSASLAACTCSRQIRLPRGPSLSPQPGMSKRKRDVAELLEHLAGLEHVGRTRIAAEAVHDDEGRPALAGLHAVRHADRAGELECARLKRDFGLGHALDPPCPRPASLRLVARLRFQDLPDDGAGVHEPRGLADARRKQRASRLICKSSRESRVSAGIPALAAFNHNQKLRTARRA